MNILIEGRTIQKAFKELEHLFKNQECNIHGNPVRIILPAETEKEEQKQVDAIYDILCGFAKNFVSGKLTEK